jgi:hypothetical protein
VIATCYHAAGKNAQWEVLMAKEKVKKMTGVFASVFSHAGHISKEDAKEISGLDDSSFEEAYAKASNVAEKLMKASGDKTDKFLDHFAEEIDEWMKEFGGKFFS